MRILDGLTYHAAVAHAQPEHYVVMKILGERVTKYAGVILHIKCMTQVDHDWNAKQLGSGSSTMDQLHIFVEEKNPEWGIVPCDRCKLY